MILKRPSFATTKLPLAVVISVTPWDEPPRIRHQVTRQLTRFYNVLYVESPRQASFKRLHHQFAQVQNRLILYQPVLPFFITDRINLYLPFIHKIFNEILTVKIKNFVQRLGYNKAILINFQFDYSQIMSSDFFFPKVYFCNDEFPMRPKNRYCRHILTKYEDQVISQADLCFAVSTTLEKKLRAKNKNVYLLLPGHEFETNLFRAEKVASREQKERISVCFMGYINYRLCIDWLLEVVANEKLFLYLVGPAHSISSVDISRFHDYPNFKWIDTLEGKALRELLESMDVFIIPYDINLEPVRHITASNKLFQYLACGKPIVISDMPNFLKLPDGFIYKARNSKEFVEKIFEAYEHDTEDLVMERIKVAMQNTWKEKGEYLHSILESWIAARSSLTSAHHISSQHR